MHSLLIIGSGIAGLSAALRLAEHHPVTLISKGSLTDGCSILAQGGIAAVMDHQDSIDSHIQDTLIAGAGLCNQAAVEFTVNKAFEAIQWLINHDVKFTKTKTQFHLTQEGGHSHRRVLHADDATGFAITHTLIQKAKNNPNISILEHYSAIDLIVHNEQCVGAYVLNNHSKQVEVFHASIVILATGGASKAYLYTSNPDSSSGDGIAMAWRAGCQIANMEFNQFHPTCLFHPKAKSFLISEALRGEGGLLRLPDGTRFMLQFHERAELAPRDIVARAIDFEMKRLGIECVYLDITHQSSSFIKNHFPNIYQHCLSLGFDITKTSIPVVPAAHYTCGGIVTNLKGETNIKGLYAIGEVAFTGLHGANRMASNSLLECIVFAASASEAIHSELSHSPLQPPIPEWDESLVTNSDEEVVVSHNWQELRRAMWDYVGIVRSNKRLERAERRIQLLKQEIQDYYAHFKITKNLIELRNLVTVADLMIQSALQRKESRGLHYNIDYPAEIDQNVIPTNTLLQNSPKIPFPLARERNSTRLINQQTQT